MSALPDPWKALPKAVAGIREDIKRLQNRSPFFGTGVTPTADNGLTIEGSLTVTSGQMQGNYAAGSSGWHLDHSGNAEFNDLTLRGGIIGNDALTNPVVPQSVWKGTTANFGLTVPWVGLTSQTLPAPPDATSVIVHGFVRLVAQNTTGVIDYLYSDLDIDGQSCGGFSTPVNPGDYGTSFCSFARVLTGVSSTTLTALGSTGNASWASGPNVCQISASVLWFR